MTQKRARKGKQTEARREDALLKRLSAGLSDEEKDRVLVSALLALDEPGLQRVVDRLGEDAGRTLRALMGSRRGHGRNAPTLVSAAKLTQEWERVWDTWWDCIAESGLEDGRYVLQEQDWDPPMLDQNAMAEDLESIAGQVRKLIEPVRAVGVASDFSMAEAFAQSAREAGAGLPEWMAPAEPGILFGSKATRCLLDWESSVAAEEGLDVYDFVRSLRALEHEDSLVALDLATVTEFILKWFEAEDLCAIFEGMERERETAVWQAELESADSGWFHLRLMLSRRCSPGRHLEICRDNFAQDWRLALPAVTERVREKAWADACDLAAMAVSASLHLGSERRWDPRTSLLVERAMRRDCRGLDEDLGRLLRSWRKAAVALGREETWRAIDVQIVIASKPHDWDAALGAVRDLPSPRFDALGEDLLAAWRDWLVRDFEDHGGQFCEQPCTAWIRGLLEAVTGPGDPSVSFRRFVDRWLRDLAKSADGLRQSVSALAALTLDLDSGGELGRSHVALGALLERRRVWAQHLEQPRRRWLDCCEATALAPRLLAFWKRNLVQLALDPASTDYDACAGWLAALIELQPAAGRKILESWSTSHRRRRNLWAAVARRGIDRSNPAASS